MLGTPGGIKIDSSSQTYTYTIYISEKSGSDPTIHVIL